MKYLILVAIITTSILTQARVKVSEISNEAYRIQSLKLNSENCLQQLQNISVFFENWMPAENEIEFLKEKKEDLLSQLFKARVNLHEQL